MAKDRTYGRGKFQAHPQYIAYMKAIAAHPHYASMPNAVSEDGHVNWQVSSGKLTSFYAFYKARFAWWISKADALGLDGTGNSNDRFSIAARKIHPTGYRPCRLCGQLFNVGYFYLNYYMAGRWNKLTKRSHFLPGQPIAQALRLLTQDLGKDELLSELDELFPERAAELRKHGATAKAFEESRHKRTRWLSPGFMCNPPDRLDGFHDYGGPCRCREKKDPGRSDTNLRSYIHDRRAFKWWAEGDWVVADALYATAGAGKCSMCGKAVKKVSPDHIGPLACGFKQIPLFKPTCGPCNSSKNRRMTAADVQRLITYEESELTSSAGWQVRRLWDSCKHLVTRDSDAKELSSAMRAVQDTYLRVLYKLCEAGYSSFLTTLLHPEYAYDFVTFDGLDPGMLTFDSVAKAREVTPNRKSLAGRSVRIAFEELQAYVSKGQPQRKLVELEGSFPEEIVGAAMAQLRASNLLEYDLNWDKVMRGTLSAEDKEMAIRALLANEPTSTLARFAPVRTALAKAFDRMGDSVAAIAVGWRKRR